MTTRYDRMRAAADLVEKYARITGHRIELAAGLRADADELEAVEQEMRTWDANKPLVLRYADRIRGEK